MNAHDRLYAVLHRRKPDRTPFAPGTHWVPRGDFEREMRNRGMGLFTDRAALVWSEMPNVTFETHVEDTVTTTVVHTPEGVVTSWARTHLSRQATTGRRLLQEGYIKGPEDYAPVISMIDDQIFHPDYQAYEWLVRDLGEDGLVRAGGMTDPYQSAYYFAFGPSDPHGLERFVYHQVDYPSHFAQLIEALERRNERIFPLIADSPAEVIGLGDVDGEYGPRQYREYVAPFYEQYVPLLHQRGKILFNHAHSSHLKSYVDLLRDTDLDMIDAFTPPPVGDLSVAEARKAWGDEVIIAVNFPESIFWEGSEATKDYTLDLIRSDPTGLLIIGMTEVGTSMVTDDQMENAYKDGMRAIMDAIDEYWK